MKQNMHIVIHPGQDVLLLDLCKHDMNRVKFLHGALVSVFEGSEDFPKKFKG